MGKISLRYIVGNIRIVWLFTWYSIKRQVKQCMWLFLIVFTIMGSPCWVGYLLYFIFKWKWCLGMATGYLMLWNVVPCTPFLAICVAITLGINRTINKIKRKRRKY